MNILELQNRLKGFSEQQLVQEMQRPTGEMPQFLVLSEITRRKKMQADLAAAETKANDTTVVEDAVAAAGVPQAGATQMAQAMAPQTDMTQNTGVAAAAPPPQRMAGGGVVALQGGGRTDDQIVRSGIIYYRQPNGTYVSESGRTLSDAATNLRNTVPDLQAAVGTISDNVADAYQSRMPDFSDVGAQMDLQRMLAEQAAQRPQGPAGGPRPQSPPYMGPDFSGVGAQMQTQRMLAEQAAQRPQGPAGGPRPPAAPTPPYMGPDFSGVGAQMDLQRFLADSALPGFGQTPVGSMPAGATPSAGFGQTPVGSMPGAGGTPMADMLRRNQLVADAQAVQAQQPQGPAGGPRPPAEIYDVTVPDFADIEAQMRAQRAVADQAAQRPQGPVGGPRPPSPPAPEGPGAIAQAQDTLRSTLAGVHDIRLPTSMYDAMDMFHGRERTPPPPPPQGPAGGPVPPAAPVPQQSLASQAFDAMSGLFGGDDTPAAPAVVEPPAAPGAPAAETTTPPAAPPAVPMAAAGVGAAPGGGGAPAAPGGVAAMQAAASTAEGEGIGSYGDELTNMLQARERRAEQDKWLALAQAGMALMASKSPTFGGAIGEAASVGLGAFREGQTAAEQDRFAMLKDLEQWRMQQIELAMAQQAMAMRGRGGGGGGFDRRGLMDYYKMLGDEQESLVATLEALDMQGATRGEGQLYDQYQAAATRLQENAAEQAQVRSVFSPFGTAPTAATAEPELTDVTQ